MANKAIRYRVYPTDEQKVRFANTFGCCRKVYNLMLSDKIESYKKTKSFGHQTPAMYKEEYPYLKKVDSLALANVQMHLEAAFRNHFDRSRKKRTRFPKFKSKRRCKKSYTTNNQKGTVAISDKAVRLPKVGWVEAAIHRHPEPDWRIKSATVTCEADGSYYISVLFEYEKETVTYIVDMDNAIGLDYASDGLYVDSNGEKGSDHRFFRESQKKLAKEQKKLARKTGSKKGEEKSRNYEKQQQKVNKIYRHITNQRKDHLHKTSTGIANRYDVVCIETLNMKDMSNKGFGNGKATMDNGYGMFCDMLQYKLEERGKVLVRVDKWYPSSQICHKCGERHPEMKDLSIRTMDCICGCHIGRDQNAAINIKEEGLRILSLPA